MNERMALLELLLAGFFSVACIKCWGQFDPDEKAGFARLLRFPDRWERLHRSRWQWFSMVLLLLVLRLQSQLPLILEVTAGFEFLLFMALPAGNPLVKGTRGQGSAGSLKPR